MPDPDDRYRLLVPLPPTFSLPCPGPRPAPATLVVDGTMDVDELRAAIEALVIDPMVDSITLQIESGRMVCIDGHWNSMLQALTAPIAAAELPAPREMRAAPDYLRHDPTKRHRRRRG